jgi:hypothetical protein
LCLLGGTPDGPGPVALLAADNFCRRRQAMLLIDPPKKWDSIAAIVQDQPRRAFSSPNALTWFPNIQFRNRASIPQMSSAIGAVAAALVASGRPGVSQLDSAPAFLTQHAARPGSDLTSIDLRRLKRLGINAVVQTAPTHFRLLNNVTLVRNECVSGDSLALDLRCQALMVLRRIRQATRWTFFHRSDEALWEELTQQIATYLTELHGRSVLAGQHAAQAFYVKCDRETNRETAGKTGEVSLIVGFALQRPGAFLAFRLQRAQGQCRIVELGWESGLEMAS